MTHFNQIDTDDSERAISTASLKINDIKTVVKMKSSFRRNLNAEWNLRQQNQDHLAYLVAEKQWNVTDTRYWASRTDNSVTKYLHFYNDHSIVVSQAVGGEYPNPVVTIETSDSDGNICSMFISVEAFSLSSIGLVIGGLAAVLMAVCNTGPGIAASASAILSEEEGVEAAITFDEVLGTIGFLVAIAALVIIIAVFLAEREIGMQVVYENRSAKRKVTLLDCWTWNLPNIKTPADLKTLHTIDGFDVYDVASYNHANDRKTEGVGLSLLFQCDGLGYANICIRNDIHKWPVFGVAVSENLIEPKDFYYNIPDSGINNDLAWGDLLIKNIFNAEQFNNYNLNGIVSFNDA